MTTVSAEAVAALVQTVADQQLRPRWRALDDDDVRRKDRGEIVTVADEAAEAELTAGLQRLAPEVPVLGEEAAAADPRLAAAIVSQPEYWLVDPLDGTSNFVAGRPEFGTMVCLVRSGRPVLACLYQPVSGRLLVAERGQGVGELGRPPSGGHATTVAGPPWPGYLHTRFLGDDHRQRLAALTDQVVARPTPRAAVVIYPDLADRAVDVVLYGRTLPWDHAAGALLIGEAGGTVRRWDGAEYRPGDDGFGLIAIGPGVDPDPVLALVGGAAGR